MNKQSAIVDAYPEIREFRLIGPRVEGASMVQFLDGNGASVYLHGKTFSTFKAAERFGRAVVALALAAQEVR